MTEQHKKLKLDPELIKDTEGKIRSLLEVIKCIELPLILTEAELYTTEVILYGVEKQSQIIQTQLSILHNDRITERKKR